VNRESCGRGYRRFGIVAALSPAPDHGGTTRDRRSIPCGVRRPLNHFDGETIPSSCLSLRRQGSFSLWRRDAGSWRSCEATNRATGPKVMDLVVGVVGAGSVVSSDVAPSTIVAGNPATVVRELTSDAYVHDPFSLSVSWQGGTMDSASLARATANLAADPRVQERERPRFPC
jgi:hypothetical protein